MTEEEKQEIRNTLDKAKEHHDLFRVPYNDAIKVCERLIDALDERDREVDQYKYVVEINSKRIEDLQGEILRLRHALEFYSNDDNWRGGLRMSSSINCDGGDTARRALEGEKFFKCYKSYKYFKVGESE